MTTDQQNPLELGDFRNELNRLLAFIHQTCRLLESQKLDGAVAIILGIHEDYIHLRSQGFTHERATFLIMQKTKKHYEQKGGQESATN